MPRPRKRPAGDTGGRSDLQAQPVRVPTGQAYGARQASEQAQQAVPVPDRNAQLQSALASAKEMSFQPVGMGPTQRPNEPITAGMPLGAGPGPEAVNVPMANDVEMQLRALYSRYPSEDLRELIEDIDSGQTF